MGLKSTEKNIQLQVPKHLFIRPAKEYYKDLGNMFVDLAEALDEDTVELIKAKHPLGNQLFEVLPE